MRAASMTTGDDAGNDDAGVMPGEFAVFVIRRANDLPISSADYRCALFAGAVTPRPPGPPYKKRARRLFHSAGPRDTTRARLEPDDHADARDAWAEVLRERVEIGRAHV